MGRAEKESENLRKRGERESDRYVGKGEEEVCI